MKILLITSAAGIDYLADCVFHGLVDSGHEVVDSKYLWYLSQPLSLDQKLRLYGRGFTLSGNLPDRSNIDRSNLEQRISAHEFDCIIYGSITRCSDYLELVKNSYKKSEVIICNGEDNTDFNMELIKIGICFKRESVSAALYPISFAIPESKLRTTILSKSQLLANIIPGTPFNYTFTDEAKYYDEYGKSMFGLTMKKGGWDCLRHYEIIANMCLPYFKDYNNCPQFIMSNWPHELQRESNAMFETKDYKDYPIVLSEFFNYCKSHLTTKCLAEYILSKLY